MSTANRLPAPFGTRIDRSRPVRFSFEGAHYDGYAGDNIASALAANDRWLLSRSFKYHRPRGVLSMAGHDANTLVQLPGDPNSLADRCEIAEGLIVTGQNYVGSLDRDRAAWIGRFSRFMPVGFYYRAFYRPRGIWEWWARHIRRLAGLGVIDPRIAPSGYDKAYRFCDVAVVGGGPAGLEAALTAAGAGAETMLIDENAELGGALNFARFDVRGCEGSRVCAALRAAVEAHPGIEVLCNTVCNGWYADHWLGLIQAKRLLRLRAQQTIFCTGGLEQPAVFRNNDLPGIMLAGAAQRLIRLYGVRPGRRAVVLAGHPDAYMAALDLLDAGVEIAAIVEMSDPASESPVLGALRARGVTVRRRHTVYAAHARADGLHLGGVEVRALTAPGECAATGERIACDLLCVSAGYVPAWQLPCQAGAQLDYDDERAAFRLHGLPAGAHLAGSINGRRSLAAVRADGRRAAAAATGGIGHRPGVHAAKGDEGEPVAAGNATWPIFAHPDGKEFVDLDEDLQIADIVNATRDGYDHIQLVKRYSTCGMGPSQGRHSALATARLVAAATARTVAETGITTARPPCTAERIAHNAGRSLFPARRSNMHHRHLEAGAQMIQAGAWYRPAFYAPAGRRAEALRAEVLAVRQAVGIVDVSTLGGIEIRGPDAAEFMERMYTWDFARAPVGRARYALMTSETGTIIDDGVACRLGSEHFYVTTTTGGAERVCRDMLRWNAQWRFAVDIANLSTAWCAVNVAGPRAREVVQGLCPGVALAAEDFPFMGVREGEVAGIGARLIRVGFVGELGFELHVPQHCGEALWDALCEAGAPLGLRPFGIEAQRILRLEKGHAIVGQDTDATTTPGEIGMDWAVSARKAFFVGGRSLRERAARKKTRRLVGFAIEDPRAPVPEENHLVLEGERIAGRVTSCVSSPTLEKTIGLAFVPPSLSAPGSAITFKVQDGIRIQARVVSLPFYDPDNARQAL